MEKCKKIHYTGSRFWLIFWIIVFFPIALVLLFTDCSIRIRDTVYHLRYAGSRFWLSFWTLFCFPVAFLLLFLNGFEDPEQAGQLEDTRGGSCGGCCH